LIHNFLFFKIGANPLINISYRNNPVKRKEGKIQSIFRPLRGRIFLIQKKESSEKGENA